MKKAILFVCILAISCANNNQKVSKEKTLDTVKSVSYTDTTVSIWEKNRQRSKSQEILTGKETFEKLVGYIWKHGFIIGGGPNKIPCGKQYTFFDSRGNRHAYLAIKIDTATNEASKTGIVQTIVTYGYIKGIKDQEHFFPYDINTTSVYCPILELDGTWKDVQEATFGYKEFLAKVNN